jgi:hypothetical protein
MVTSAGNPLPQMKNGPARVPEEHRGRLCQSNALSDLAAPASGSDRQNGEERHMAKMAERRHLVKILPEIALIGATKPGSFRILRVAGNNQRAASARGAVTAAGTDLGDSARLAGRRRAPRSKGRAGCGARLAAITEFSQRRWVFMGPAPFCLAGVWWSIPPRGSVCPRFAAGKGRQMCRIAAFSRQTAPKAG